MTFFSTLYVFRKNVFFGYFTYQNALIPIQNDRSRREDPGAIFLSKIDWRSLEL